MNNFYQILSKEFLYDQGVNLALAITTFLALLITLGNIIYTNHKNSISKLEEERKTQNLLKILNITTKFFVDDLNRLKREIMNDEAKEKNTFSMPPGYHKTESGGKPEDLVKSNTKLKYHYSTYSKIKYLKIEEENELFIEKIEHFLNTQSLNFDSHSLEKISQLINDAQKLKNSINSYTQLLKLIFKFMESPKFSSNNLNAEFDKYDQEIKANIQKLKETWEDL